MGGGGKHTRPERRAFLITFFSFALFFFSFLSFFSFFSRRRPPLWWWQETKTQKTKNTQLTTKTAQLLGRYSCVDHVLKALELVTILKRMRERQRERRG